MGRVAAQLFSGLSRDDWLGSSPGSGWVTQGYSETCPEATSALCLGLLSFWKVSLRPSLRSWVLWSRFSSRISLYFALFIFPSILTSLPVPASEKHPHTMMLPIPCFIIGMVAGFLVTWHLAFMPKTSILISSDRESCFSWSESPLVAFWQTPSRLSCDFYWEVASVWPLYCNAMIGGVLQRWLSFWKVLPSPQRNYGALLEWPLGSWSPPWPWPLYPNCSVFGNSRKSLGGSKLLPFKNDGPSMLQKCFGTFPKSVPRHNPVSELYEQFLQPHGLVFALTCTVNCGTLYRQMCAFPN